MTQPSPLPWKSMSGIAAYSESCKDRGPIFECHLSTGTHIPEIQNKINAEYIIKACNLFPCLVEALEAEHRHVIDDQSGGWDGDVHKNYGRKPCDVCELLKEARGIK